MEVAQVWKYYIEIAQVWKCCIEIAQVLKVTHTNLLELQKKNSCNKKIKKKLSIQKIKMFKFILSFSETCDIISWLWSNSTGIEWLSEVVPQVWECLDLNFRSYIFRVDRTTIFLLTQYAHEFFFIHRNLWHYFMTLIKEFVNIGKELVEFMNIIFWIFEFI